MSGIRARGTHFAIAILLAACVFGCYFFYITGTGLLGPDEPRYASIGREMYRSGDWITPRLWGEPWFEKPPLLYWLTALGFAAGLSDDAAPRVPVALLCVAFLLLYWRSLTRQSGSRAAWFSVIVLGTSAGWVALSQIGVTDLPLAVTFSAGMYLAWDGLERNRPANLRWAGAMFGLSVLAKGLVGVTLALPLVWFAWKRWREFMIPVAIGIAVALPWYVLMTLRHGKEFLADFFVKHHFTRFTDASIAHPQPWWFYLPVLLLGLFPWTPLAVLIRRDAFRNRFGVFMGLWLAFGLLFFSLSTNKLPGYVLPLFPAACAIMGSALSHARRAKAVVATCVLLLSLTTVIAGVLPQALIDGLSRVSWGDLPVLYLLAVAPFAVIAALLDRRGQRSAAMAMAGSLTVAAIVYLKLSIYPVLDQLVSARSLWRDHASSATKACLGELSRDDRYGLNYYSPRLLTECEARPGEVKIERRP